MANLEIIAEVPGPLCLPRHPPALDALLAYAVCIRDQVPPALLHKDLVRIEIPIEYEPEQRFHLCSFAEYEVDAYEKKYLHKRAPIEQYQTIGDERIRRVQITAGPNKSYRIPYETVFLRDGEIRWWCVGKQKEIIELLSLIFYLGKYPRAGVGKVKIWHAKPRRPWGNGFPVVRDGRALRNLPLDWPGVVEHRPAHGRLTYPYWLKTKQKLILSPGRHE